MDEASDDVRYETDGRIATISLDRPQYRNAQSRNLLESLDHAFGRGHAGHRADVGLVDLSLLKCHAQGSEGGLRFREDADAGRVPVQSVRHPDRVAVGATYARNEGVMLVRLPARDEEQARALVDDEDVVVLVEYLIGRAGQGRAVVLRGGERYATTLRVPCRRTDAPTRRQSCECL